MRKGEGEGTTPGSATALPLGWATAEVGEVAEVSLGKMLDKAKHTSGRLLPYLRNQNVRWGTFDLSDLVSMYFEDHELERFSLRGGDVIVCEGGEPGRAAVWDEQVASMRYQKALHRVRPYGGLLPHWIVYALQVDAGAGRLAPLFTGSTIKHLPREAIVRWRVRIPPVIEQRRIVEALDSYLTRLDAAAEGLRRVEANLKRYRASVLKAAVEGRLVPTEAELAKREGRAYEPASELLARILKERRRRWEAAELAKLKAKGESPKSDTWKSKYQAPAAPDPTNLPTLPEGWCWTTVEQLLADELCHGRSVKDRAGGFPVLRLTALGEENIKLNEAKDGDWDAAQAWPFVVKEGDFLVARGNGSIRLVGRGALVSRVARPVAFPDTMIRVRIDDSLALPRYIGAFWNSYFLRGQIERKAKTTAGIHKVNQADIRSLVIPLAPKVEQERIVEGVDAALALEQPTRQAVENDGRMLSRLRQSILTWAFEGKLVDQDPNDEPASALLERIRAQRIAAEAAPKPGQPRRPTRARKGS